MAYTELEKGWIEPMLALGFKVDLSLEVSNGIVIVEPTAADVAELLDYDGTNSGKLMLAASLCTYDLEGERKWSSADVAGDAPFGLVQRCALIGLRVCGLVDDEPGN